MSGILNFTVSLYWSSRLPHLPQPSLPQSLSPALSLTPISVPQPTLPLYPKALPNPLPQLLSQALSLSIPLLSPSPPSPFFPSHLSLLSPSPLCSNHSPHHASLASPNLSPSALFTQIFVPYSLLFSTPISLTCPLLLFASISLSHPYPLSHSASSPFLCPPNLCPPALSPGPETPVAPGDSGLVYLKYSQFSPVLITPIFTVDA